MFYLWPGLVTCPPLSRVGSVSPMCLWHQESCSLCSGSRHNIAIKPRHQASGGHWPESPGPPSVCRNSADMADADNRHQGPGVVTILGPSRQMHSRVFMASQLTLSRVSPSKKVHSEKVKLDNFFHFIDEHFWSSPCPKFSCCWKRLSWISLWPFKLKVKWYFGEWKQEMRSVSKIRVTNRAIFPGIVIIREKLEWRQTSH